MSCTGRRTCASVSALSFEAQPAQAARLVRPNLAAARILGIHMLFILTEKYRLLLLLKTEYFY